MPTGTAPVSPAQIAQVGANKLKNAILSDVTSSAWTLDPVHSSGVRTLADPRPDDYSKVGKHAPVHGLAWFDKIHVIPRKHDFGPVLTDQEIQVEVWNAFVAGAKSLTTLAVTGPTGIEVDNPLGLPAHFPGTESKLYTVRALAKGDPEIRNTVTWTFTGVSSLGTDLTLSGLRMRPYPFKPDAAAKFRERYGYRSRVLTSRNRTEQRFSLRATPNGSITMATKLKGRDAQHAEALLTGMQARPIGVPWWPYATRLETQASSGQKIITIDTTSVPYAVKGLIFLWQTPYLWEVASIESFTSSQVTCTLNLRSTWPVGTLVMPLVIGRLSNDEPIDWHALEYAETPITFSIDKYKP